MKKELYLITKYLKTLYKIGKIFIQQPKLGFRLLARLPEIVRGFNSSQEWPSSAVDNTLPTLSDSTAPPNPLRAYFNSHKEGKGIWKWVHYFDVYHQHFKKFVGREVHILEIGVYSGGSLEMWRNYFGSQCHVYGVDIEEACKVYENECTKIFIGDQADRKFWKFFKKQIPRIDILIDDGGHQIEQHIATLEEMLPHLSPGGVYLCEDLHGVNSPFGFYLYGLTAGFHDTSGASETGVSPTRFQRWIKSIQFYPYITVIEKTENPREKFISSKHGTEWQPFL